MANSPTAIKVRSGKFIDVFDFDPYEVEIEDLASAAVRIPRFGGHGRFRWSIAAHMLLVAQLAPPAMKLQSISHDLEESLLGVDLPAPIKHAPPMVAFRQLSRDLLAALLPRFGAPAVLAPEVKEADNLAGWAEAVALFEGGYSDWSPESQPPNDAFMRRHIDTIARRVVPRPDEDVYEEYLAKFEEYGGKR